MIPLFRHALALMVLAVFLPAAHGQTASKAVSVVTRMYGTDYNKRLVAVTGENGGPQPAQWHVFANDLRNPSTISHWVVAGGKITAAAMLDAQRSRQWAVPVLPYDRVKIDSDAAFKVADTTARAARVGFDSIDFRLMADRQSRAPVWMLNLFDARGQPVGSLRIDATRGSLLSQTWGRGGFGADRFDWTVVKQEMGKIGRDIGNSWQKFKADVRDKFSR